MIEHLHEIGVTIISSWIFNCYVIHDGGQGRPFVVDAGTPTNADLAERTLAERRLTVHDIASVVATHGHADHVGGLPRLRGADGVTVGLPSRIRDYVAGEVPRSPGLRAMARILPVSADQPFDLAALREFAAASKEIGFSQFGVLFPFEPEHWLSEGDTVPGAPDWQVLHTPGHTDDSISLWCEKTRTLLSGDAVLAVGRRAWFNPEFVDAGLSAATEKRLRDLDVEYLLPGHGRAVAGNDVLAGAMSFSERPRDDSAIHNLRQVFRSHRHR